MTVIETQNLTKDFNGTVALSHLDLAIPAGSIYGFLGPNGAGKTTTIKLILGLLRPTSGSIHVFGNDVSNGRLPRSIKRKVAYLPQDPVFPGALTGREVLTFIAGVYDLPPRAARTAIANLLESFELQGAANRKVGTYSRGMKQRLGLAAVLLPQPDLLILDEPVSALDPEGRHAVLQLVSELRRAATVFFSSHVLNDVQRVCDHVAIIRQGELVVADTMEELLSKYTPSGYRITVAGDTEEALAILRSGTMALDRVTQNEQGELVVHSLQLTDTELAERLLPTLVEHHVVVTGFSPIKPELEEIFVELVHSRREGGTT